MNPVNDVYKNEQESVHAVVGAVINIIAHGLKIEVDGAPAVWDVLQELEDLFPASTRAFSDSQTEIIDLLCDMKTFALIIDIVLHLLSCTGKHISLQYTP